MDSDRMDAELQSASGLALLMLGALIGASLALLFTTERGGRTRQQIREAASEAARRARTATDAAVTRAREAAGQGREYVKEQLAGAYGAGQETVTQPPGDSPTPAGLGQATS